MADPQKPINTVMQRLLVFLFSILFSTASSAIDSTRIAIYAHSHHLKSNRFNDYHPMLQLEVQKKWIVGGFVNSINRWSWYSARRVQSTTFGKPFIEVGIASGYTSSVVRSVRIGVEINENLDFVILPGFASNYSWRVVDPVSVAAVIVKF